MTGSTWSTPSGEPASRARRCGLGSAGSRTPRTAAACSSSTRVTTGRPSATRSRRASRTSKRVAASISARSTCASPAPMRRPPGLRPRPVQLRQRAVVEPMTAGTRDLRGLVIGGDEVVPALGGAMVRYVDFEQPGDGMANTTPSFALPRRRLVTAHPEHPPSPRTLCASTAARAHGNDHVHLNSSVAVLRGLAEPTRLDVPRPGTNSIPRARGRKAALMIGVTGGLSRVPRCLAVDDLNAP